MPLTAVEKNVQQYTDAEVITNIWSGNTAMFEILIRRYNSYLYKVARGYGFNHQDAEDLMQETFVNSYINLKQFAARSSFKTWIIRIMLNQCYHKANKYSYKKEIVTDLLPDNSSYMFSNNDHNDNSRAVVNRELNRTIEACIQALPENYRITFTLRELSGLGNAETAEILHTTQSNIKVRLNRAKAILRKEIEKIYSPEDIYEFNLIYCNRITNAVMQKIYALAIH